MASIHLGFLMGTAGFSRLVAFKRMHAELAQDPAFAARFKHELMLGAQVRHPNVIQVLDVVEWHDELMLVMEFIHGENLAGLVHAADQSGKQLPLEVALAVITSALHGLHAAHEALNTEGAPLHLVHRDFSPQNVLVGSDGHSRVLDFGVAKSSSQSVVTRVGHIAGKVPYMAPEQLRGEALDRRADVFSVGVVLWEALTGARLFGADDSDSPTIIFEVLSRPIVAPSHFRPEIPAVVERAVLRALNRDPSKRFASARDFALELEASGAVAGPTVVANCVQTLCADRLRQLSEQQARASRALSAAQRRGAAEGADRKSEGQSFELNQPLRSGDSPATHFAGVESSAPGVAPPTLRRRQAALIAILAVVTAIALFLVWSSRQSQELSAKTIRVASPSAPSAVPGTAPVEPVPVPVPVPIESATYAAASSSTSTTRRSFLAPRASQNGGRPAPQAGCAQPTYLDERGIRHFKPQCL